MRASRWSGWLVRGWAAWLSRSRWFRGLTALVVGAGLLAGAQFLIADSSGGPSVPGVKSAHGVHTLAHRKARTLPDDARANATPGPGSLPTSSSGTATFDLKRLNERTPTAARAHVPGTPVWAQPVAPARGKPYQGPTKVQVTVAQRELAQNLGVKGVLFSATPTGGSGPVAIGVDYHHFAAAYGGNFGTRLHLVSLPTCALTTPQVPACRTQTPLPHAGNYVRGQNVYAQVDASTVHATGTSGAAQPTMVLAATTGSATADGGPAGTYGATSLKPSDSWTGGGTSGSFTYTYPLQAPPAPSALAPKLDLAYDSGSLDGQTSSTQAQANWLGDGWTTPQSYVERSFKPCSDSPEGTAAPKSTADDCYDGEVLTMSLNGSTTSLVWDATKKTYTPADDNGQVVKHLTGTNNGTGTHDTDYWQITDRTGTTYTFGRNQLPGWASGKATTNSVDTVPVYSAHSGDPCYNADWASSWCVMAYRWNLDYVTDVHGNAMAYYYKQDTNSYARNADTSGTTTPKATSTYVRDSHLDHIDYGFTDGNAYTVNSGHAPDQVQFTTGDRCLSGTCDPLNATNAKNWPDVPYDLNCALNANCLVTSPSFWSTVRLTGIKTQQWNGTAYAPVDTWNFTQTLPATGDGTSPTLWLSAISHTGADTAAGGTAVTLPDVRFTARAMDNRLDKVTDGLPGLTRMRISSITTETGSVIGVNYTLADPCSANAKPSPATNTGSCYPVYWTPQDSTQLLDWFLKYQVHSVTQSDPTGGGVDKYTSYNYRGGGAWHFDDNELVKAKYRTYGQWRGYGDVQTFTGQGTDPQTQTETTFYRGMSKNNAATAVSLADSQGGAHEDLDQLAGQTLEETNYNYAGGAVTGSTIHSYWVSPATATRTRTGLPALTAGTTAEVESWSRQALTSGGSTTWRKTETDTSYDDNLTSPTFGLPRIVYDHGDLADTTQRRCAITTYAAANTAKNLVGLTAEAETDAAACGGSNPDGATAPAPDQINALTAPTGLSRPNDVVSDERTFYDAPDQAKTWPQPAGPTWPQAAPTLGDVSLTQKASGYSSGAFTYQTQQATVYDAIGRPVDSWDARGNKTHTDYTADTKTGLVTALKITNPLGQATSSTLDPLRGLELTSTDANGITSTKQYDGLGRVTAVWTNSRPTTAPANAKYTYQISPTAPPAVTLQKMNDAQGYVTSTTLYDALMRPRQTQNATPQGGRLVADTFYDSHGWTWKTNNKWWDQNTSPTTSIATVDDSQVPDQTVTAHDGAGRPVLTTSYNDSQAKSKTATIYDLADGGNQRTLTVPLDGNGNSFNGATARATVKDALDRTIETDDYTTPPSITINHGSGPAPITTVTATGGSTTASNGKPQATQYLFDKTGHQTDVKSLATGDTWHSDYDLLGRTTSKQDPDAGTTTMKYNAAGQVTETTDARGKTLSFTYDALGRKTAQYNAPVTGQSADTQMASWVYDNSDGAVAGMPYPIGQLTHTTAYTGGSGSAGKAYSVQERGFNVFGKPLGEVVSIPSSEGSLGTTYTFGHAYTTNTGLPLRDTYPASGTLPAETVTHGYSTALDLPNALSSNLTSYATNVTWNAFGQDAQQRIGTTSVNAYITNTYDPHTGKLTDTQLANTNLTATPIDHTTYTYDPLGNPTSQTETRQGTQSETQCYTYDSLNRLTQAWTANDACQSDPTTNNGSTVGSAIPAGAYWTTWQYSPLGERTKQTEHGLGGSADSVTDSTYDGNGSAQPHTLTATTTTGSKAGTTSYAYDKSGNMTTRVTPDQGTQNLTWSADGHLTSVTGGKNGDASYLYDADGDLLLQKQAGTTTLYLPDEQLALDTAGTLHGTRYYDLPGGGQAVRTGTGDQYTFQTSDQQGTSLLTLDSTLTKATWRQQTPYGAPRGTAPASWPDNHGFLGQVQDATTGLTNLGARWYDPATGAFASLDPLFQPEDSQQQNGYGYSGGNPTTYSDPAGTTKCDVGICPTPGQDYHGPNWCETHDCSKPGAPYDGDPADDPDQNPHNGLNGHYDPNSYDRYHEWLRHHEEIAREREHQLFLQRLAAERAAARREDMLNRIRQLQNSMSLSHAGCADPISCTLGGMKQDMKNAFAYVGSHFGVNYGACFFACATLTFQDGEFWLSYDNIGNNWGVEKGFEDWGKIPFNFRGSWSVQYTSATPDEGNSDYFQGGAGYGPYVSAMGAKSGPNGKAWGGASIGEGFGYTFGHTHSVKLLSLKKYIHKAWNSW